LKEKETDKVKQGGTGPTSVMEWIPRVLARAENGLSLLVAGAIAIASFLCLIVIDSWLLLACYLVN
jgi:hypothetical protein